jgi:transcriptional regulator with XRE-family HTH domain
MPRSRLAPFDLRPGAEKYYTRQDVLDRVNFSRHTLSRFIKNKTMPTPVESNELDYSYQLWLRKDFDQWLENNPQFDREKKTGRTNCDVRLHFRPREMAVIRLAAQCAYQLEVDTDEFMKHAIIHYAQQVLRLTYDDFLTQEKRKNPDLSLYDTSVLLRKVRAYHEKINREEEERAKRRESPARR